MRSFGAALVTAAALLGLVAAQDVDPIVIKGSKFFYKTNGTQFFIKGIAYQQDYTGAVSEGSDSSGSYNDPLADPQSCRRDIPLLKQLGTNTIRVYALNPDADHDECMSAMADAGIYVVADLSAPVNGQSINRDDPAWNDDLYARYVSVVDMMAGYTNTLGFFAGNEVANAPNNTNAAPFVKAAVRDMKSYIKKAGYRDIGVGYATSDNEFIRVQMADYFNCGNQDDAIDFWGYNIYSWCGYSSYQESGYKDRTEEFASYSVPSFFAEYGCNTEGTRPFTEVQALYGDEMSQVFSGGIVYMYFQEDNDYGVVSIGNDDQATKLADFTSLSKQIAKATPTGVESANYNPTNQPAACPTQDNQWDAVSSPLPPTPNEELCSCMYSALTCAVNPSVEADTYKKAFSQVCENSKTCAGFEHDATTGTYGAYSMCNATQQLGWAFQVYWNAHGKSDQACDWDGVARLQDPVSPDGRCKELLQQAGAQGTGTVTSQPSGTGAGSGGSGGGGGSGSESSEGAAAMVVPKAESGLLPMALVVSIGALSGMAMVFL